MNVTRDESRSNRIVGISWLVIGAAMVLTGIVIGNVAFVGCGTVFITLSAVWFRRGKSKE